MTGRTVSTNPKTAGTAFEISVVICTRNRSNSLKNTLSALSRLRFPGPTEVVVVNNASEDDTSPMVRDLALDYPVQLRVIEEPAPGKSAALNAAIRAARGSILAFTDDDAMPERDWLVELERTFETWQCDWAFGRVVPAWESAPPSWFGPDLCGVFALLDFGHEPFLVSERQHMFFGVNCAVRRVAIDSLGPYCADLGPTNGLGGGGEDTEMFYRALSAGQRIVYAPSAVVAHVIPAARTTRAFHRKRMFNGRRNGYRLVCSDRAAVPRLIGIPRYQYRHALSDLGAYARATLARDSATAFSRELRLIFFAGIVQQAIVGKLRRDSRSSTQRSTLRMDRL